MVEFCSIRIEVAHQIDDDELQQFFATNMESAVMQFGVVWTAHGDGEVVASLLRQPGRADASEDSEGVVGIYGYRIAAK